MMILPAFVTLSSRPPGIGDAGASLAGASLIGASLMGASLAGASLASGALEPPPLLVHAPTAIAATASRTRERRPRRQGTPSMYSSKAHRSPACAGHHLVRGGRMRGSVAGFRATREDRPPCNDPGMRIAA